jgi:DNA end-binding protein Ku
MERTGRAGIATFVMRGKEYLVAITAQKGILSAATLRFQDEIRTPAKVGLPRQQKAGGAQVRSFEQLIKKRSRNTLPAGALRDEETHELEKIVKQKQRQKANVVEVSNGERKAPVIDLVDVLRQSLRAPGGR